MHVPSNEDFCLDMIYLNRKAHCSHHWVLEFKEKKKVSYARVPGERHKLMCNVS